MWGRRGFRVRGRPHLYQLTWSSCHYWSRHVSWRTRVCGVVSWADGVVPRARRGAREAVREEVVDTWAWPVGYSYRRTSEVGRCADAFAATDRGVHLSARGGGMKVGPRGRESSGGMKSARASPVTVFPFFCFVFSFFFLIFFFLFIWISNLNLNLVMGFTFESNIQIQILV
jgi:hypothetical protein